MARLPQFAFICLVSLALTACMAAESTTKPAPQMQSSAEQLSSPSARSTGGSNPQDSNTPAQSVSLEQADKAKNTLAVTERKIIRNANLSLETDTPEETGRKIAALIEGKGGFLITSETQARAVSGGAERSTVNLVLRVPAAQFDAAVNEIRQTALRVVQEKVSGQDVTEEFIDLEARINAKKALEAQFLEIMKQSRTVADALQVQRELSEVRGEIEKLEGRRKFLESQTSLSTINITLNPPAAFAASSNGFFYQLGRAFSNGIDAALQIVLFLITAFLALLPIIIILGVPLYLLYRYFRRRFKRRKLAEELAQEEKS
jgi:hypothetical protein